MVIDPVGATRIAESGGGFPHSTGGAGCCGDCMPGSMSEDSRYFKVGKKNVELMPESGVSIVGELYSGGGDGWKYLSDCWCW